MKTTFKTLVAALLLAVCPINIIAQDTVHWHSIPENYLAPEWPDSSYFRTYPGVFQTFFIFSKKGGIINYTDSALTVYGIAASLITELDWGTPEQIARDAEEYEDTTREGLNPEHLVLWEMKGTSNDNFCYHDSNIYQVGEDLLVRFDSEQPDYYWDLGLIRPLSGNPICTFPMYERYFAEPVVVQDSFIVGKLVSNGLYYDKPDSVIVWKTWPVDVASIIFVTDTPDFNFVDVPTHLVSWVRFHVGSVDGYGYDTTYWKREVVPHTGYLFIFPILTPNPDTTRAGIGNVRAEERLVGVMPNPATGQVKVVSSFGMTHFDVYDAAGRRVLSRDVQGLQASFDVAAWPRGAYTVHVLTPAGTTVKKLLVE